MIVDWRRFVLNRLAGPQKGWLLEVGLVDGNLIVGDKHVAKDAIPHLTGQLKKQAGTGYDSGVLDGMSNCLFLHHPRYPSTYLLT